MMAGWRSARGAEHSAIGMAGVVPALKCHDDGAGGSA